MIHKSHTELVQNWLNICSDILQGLEIGMLLVMDGDSKESDWPLVG